MADPTPTIRDRRGRVYKPAVGPFLKPLLIIVLGGFALLGANGVYLAIIKALSLARGSAQYTPFYYWMFLFHLGLGFLLIVPFIIFGLVHLVTSWKRPNKAAVRYGLMLLFVAITLLVTGLLIVRVEGVIDVRDPRVRDIGYWLHVGTPVVAIVLYVLHRLAGPRIRWEYARAWGGVVAVFVAGMAILHGHDPRQLTVKGSKEGLKYFYPSEARTTTGNFIPERALMMDEYCMKCHKDVYDGWFHSSHHFSSFNNKMYLFSVRETRQVGLKRDGSTRAARWCAGCHDPVPFFSGAFDLENYDDVGAPSSQAGITCVSCHSIVHVDNARGNAAYTIEEAEQYPLTFSKDPLGQWLNGILVKAKPEMHKKTFIKPLHKDSQFCSTCHKVSIPYGVNHYKDFLRGQNHYDTFYLSGNGHGARSFYYPPKAKNQCTSCHMNLVASRDFGARDFDASGERKIHNHMFPGANTGLSALRGDALALEAHTKFLRDNQARIDIFGLREGGTIEGDLAAPLRPKSPVLEPGKSYLVEVVARTLGLGHPLSQGTVDSNEIWVELIARSDGRVIGRSGGIDKDGFVDSYAHFINVYMLTPQGKRVDRRNPQDIFVPLYNKQIPPGAGQVVHFKLDVPRSVQGPIELEAAIRYRKFDRTYMDYVFGKGEGPDLPVVTMASDKVKLALKGSPVIENPASPIKDEWQRYNDYGIGLFLEGEDKGAAKGELRQAEEAFLKVVELGKADGWVNLGRVYLREGRIPEAVDALAKAAQHKEPGAPWVIAWLTGQINARNGYFDEAVEQYQGILNTKIPARNFDFSTDYEVINALASAHYSRARRESLDSPERVAALEQSIEAYRRTLAIDSENIAANYNLGLIYAELARAGGAAQPAAAPSPVGTAEKPAPVSEESLLEPLARAAAPKAKAGDRAQAARDLEMRLKAFMEGPRSDLTSRIDPLYELIEKLGDLRLRETDPQAKSAMASALSALHKSLHAMLKPDETAEGRAFAVARSENPAADQNAQSIVIHHLHRNGAPGIDPSPLAGQ